MSTNGQAATGAKGGAAPFKHSVVGRVGTCLRVAMKCVDRLCGGLRRRCAVSVAIVVATSGWQCNVAWARQIVIAKDGTGDFTSISAGAIATASGDTLLIRAGRYGDGLIDASQKTLWIMGESGTNRPIIDAPVFGIASESNTIVLQRLIISNSGDSDGAVVFLRDYGRVHIEATDVTGNDEPVILAACRNVSVVRCLFAENHTVTRGNAGGALHIGGGRDALVSWCRFINNSTASGTPGVGGGGGALYSNATAGGVTVIEHCEFDGNKAPSGGAVWLRNGYVFRQNTVVFNESADGAVYLSAGDGQADAVANVFAWNSGYGLWDEGDVLQEYCWCNAYWENTGAGGILDNEGQSWGTCAARGANGPTVFVADPLFCDPEGGNLGLLNASPLLAENRDLGLEECGLTIGAYDVKCDITPPAVRRSTWGQIKSLFGGRGVGAAR